MNVVKIDFFASIDRYQKLNYFFLIKVLVYLSNTAIKSMKIVIIKVNWYCFFLHIGFHHLRTAVFNASHKLSHCFITNLFLNKGR